MADNLERLKTALADRYRIERELGAGGMATVYLATDLKHHRQIAIKVLRPELAAVLGADRFLREIDITAQLDHPHILPLLDSGRVNLQTNGGVEEVLYYVMPNVEGESLRDRLKRERQLPLDDALQIAREVADALSYAHSRGVIHRDIKPENILLSGGHARVVDFGIARAVNEAGGERLTETGMAIGTAMYMSPEQASGERELDGRSDLYSLGCVLYEMLAGRPPFTGPTVESVIHQHLITEAPAVTSIRPAVPAEIAGILQRALAKNPADRFNPVAQFANALGGPRALLTQPEPVSHDRSRSRLPASRRLAIGGAAVLVVILLAVAFLRFSAGRSGAAAELGARLLPLASQGEYDPVFDSLQVAGLSLSAGGLEALAAAAGAWLSIETEPQGATVRLTRAQPVDRFAERRALEVGPTPFQDLLAVAGEYLVELEHPQMNPVMFVVTLKPGEKRVVTRTLLQRGQGWEDMVLVPAGPAPRGGDGAPVSPFLIDRLEVTNRKYREFVSDDGYRNPSLWPVTVLVDGSRIPRDPALSRLVDRTGLPGPRGWTGGNYPEGSADFPVTGVSWYEAAAYARWAGKELPTAAQWWRAALGDTVTPYPWGADVKTIEQRSNFTLTAIWPVGSRPLGVSPFGCLDMAGNAREWLRPSPGDSLYPAVGGSWQNPTYSFDYPEALRPDYASDAIGFRLVMPAPRQ